MTEAFPVASLAQEAFPVASLAQEACPAASLAQEAFPVASLVREVIVEVGPCAVRGPNDVRPEWVSAALDCIDDEIALIDDRPVFVPDIWHEVMHAAAGTGIDTVVLVCPTWWSSPRIDRVRTAAEAVAATVVVLQRTPLLGDPRTTVVELAADFVVVTQPRGGATVVPRTDDAAAVTEAVAAAVSASAAVLVDVPAGVHGESLGAAIADHLRATGVAVSFTDEAWVLRAAAASRARRPGRSVEEADVRPRIGRHRRGTAVMVGVVSAAVLCGGFAVRGDRADSAASTMPTTLLVEGRVGVMVPAGWTVRRITSGPGSARVQIVSPSDADVGLHVTQSPGVPHQTLAMAAESLRVALDEHAGGVFVDFNPSDSRADRAAVTYREVRPEYHVAWVVLIDETVRIAIGCQSVPGRGHLVRDACDQAIRSAHAVY